MNVLRLVRISFCICDWLLRNLSFLPIKKTCTLQFFPCKNSDLFLTSPDKTNERELFFTKCIKLCSIFFQFEGNYKCHFIFGCFGEIPYLWQLYTIQRQKMFYERHVGLKNSWTWLPIYQWWHWPLFVQSEISIYVYAAHFWHCKSIIVVSAAAQ